MNREPEKKVLRDAQGGEHKYVTHLHDGLSGWDLFMEVNEAILASGVQAAAASFGSAISGTGEDSLDGEQLARAIIRMSNLLRNRELIRRLCETTTRDAVRLNDAWATAYAGNYGEAIEALVWIVSVNFIDPLLTSLLRFKETAEGAKVMSLLKRSSPPVE